jgi:hypothetical protein
MSFRIRLIRRPRTCTVVFTATPEGIAAMDVGIGPCIERVGPRGGRIRPLVSPWDQHPDRIDHLVRLFAILVAGDRGDLCVERIQVGRGTLDTLSPNFVAALREVETGSERVQHAWLDAIDWPKGQQIGGLTMRLLDYAAKAEIAHQRGQALYCWSGPELPFLAIASGRTQRDYDEYRRAMGRG